MRQKQFGQHSQKAQRLANKIAFKPTLYYIRVVRVRQIQTICEFLQSFQKLIDFFRKV